MLTYLSGTTSADGKTALLTLTGFTGHLFLGKDDETAIGTSGRGPGADGVNVFGFHFSKNSIFFAGGITPGGSKFSVSSPPSNVLAVNISALNLAYGDVLRVYYEEPTIVDGWCYDSADTANVWLDPPFGSAGDVTVTNGMSAPASTALHVPNQIGAWLSAGD